MKKGMLLCVFIGLLTGCATTQLKAPCNATGSNCGARIKINQWSQTNPVS